MFHENNKTLQEIKNTPENISTEEIDEIVEAVGVLENTYLKRDLQCLKVLALEQLINYTNVTGVFEGTMDLKATVIDTGDYYPDDFVGKTMIVDWKTKDSASFDTRWKQEKIDSWQWRLYSMVEKSHGFEYRGVSRASGATKSVLLRVPKDNETNAIEYIEDVLAMQRSIIDKPVWPRHKPFACHAYNRECPFFKSCSKDQAPEGMERLIQIKPLHYTTAETFLLCPERFRLLQILEETAGKYAETSRYTRFGGAVHRGIASVYTQAFKL